MIRTQIQLTSQQMNSLKSLSLEQHKSVAELIRQAINNWFLKNQAIDREKLKKRALTVVGRYQSSYDDISVNHDKHLGETFGL